MRRSLALSLVAALLAAGCSGGDPVPDPSGGTEAMAPVEPPFASCDQLSDPPRHAPTPAPASSAVPAEARLPSLDLVCFTGEDPFPLAELRGPAVVNLWASWCPPCRAELPVLQRLADRSEGRLHVLGVVTGDLRRPAAALADDLGLRFPSLYDPAEQLSKALGRIGLPVTVFVDQDGQISHVHQGPPFDEPELTGLVAEHLRVEVPSG